MTKPIKTYRLPGARVTVPAPRENGKRFVGLCGKLASQAPVSHAKLSS